MTFLHFLRQRWVANVGYDTEVNNKGWAPTFSLGWNYWLFSFHIEKKQKTCILLSYKAEKSSCGEGDRWKGVISDFKFHFTLPSLQKRNKQTKKTIESDGYGTIKMIWNLWFIWVIFWLKGSVIKNVNETSVSTMSRHLQVYTKTRKQGRNGGKD